MTKTKENTKGKADMAKEGVKESLAKQAMFYQEGADALRMLMDSRGKRHRQEQMELAREAGEFERKLAHVKARQAVEAMKSTADEVDKADKEDEEAYLARLVAFCNVDKVHLPYPSSARERAAKVAKVAKAEETKGNRWS